MKIKASPVKNFEIEMVPESLGDAVILDVFAGHLANSTVGDGLVIDMLRETTGAKRLKINFNKT